MTIVLKKIMAQHTPLRKLIPLFMFVTLIMPGFAFSICKENPSDNEVSFFEHTNFKGKCTTLSIGNYSNSGAIGIRNDSISSIRVGRSVQAVVCRDRSYLGHCELIRVNDRKLSNNSIKNDTISSVKVQRRGTIECNPGRRQVAFYMHSNFLAPCVRRNIGGYRSSTSIGLRNDSISSIRVGSDAQAIVCRDINYRGRCQLVTTNIGRLQGSRVGNDSISSAEVQRRGAVGGAGGNDPCNLVEVNVIQEGDRLIARGSVICSRTLRLELRIRENVPRWFDRNLVTARVTGTRISAFYKCSRGGGMRVFAELKILNTGKKYRSKEIGASLCH